MRKVILWSSGDRISLSARWSSNFSVSNTSWFNGWLFCYWPVLLFVYDESSSSRSLLASSMSILKKNSEPCPNWEANPMSPLKLFVIYLHRLSPNDRVLFLLNGSSSKEVSILNNLALSLSLIPRPVSLTMNLSYYLLAKWSIKIDTLPLMDVLLIAFWIRLIESY